MKRCIALLLAAAVTLGLCAGASVYAAGDEADVWVSDWRENVFHDFTMPADGARQASLTAARGDVEPFQVNVRAPADGRILGVAFSDLVCGEQSIPAANFSYNFVDYVRSRSNSRYTDATDPDAVLGDWDLKWVTCSNPMRIASADNIVSWPEILSNEQSKDVKADTTQPIWIKVRVPDDAAPGVYSGWLQVRTSMGEYDVDVTVDVKDVSIPAPSAPSAFSLEIWSQLVGNFDTAIDVVVDAYGVEVDSPEWWEIMSAFAAIMRENRLNVLAVNQTQLLLHAPGTSVAADGTVTFDWSFFNKFVSFFQEHAGIQQFSCGPLAKYKANPKNYDNNIPGEEENDYTKAYVEVIAAGPDGAPCRQLLDVDFGAYAMGQELPATEYLKQYAAALYENLTAQGWLDVWTHHIIDEPGKDNLGAMYPKLEKILSDGCPGIRTGDAFTVWTAEAQTTHTEIFAVIENSYEELQDRMAKALKEGDTFWLYTSNVPMKDNYLNRTIDQPVWMMEMLGWLCYKRGATGYLHWGFNQWNTWTTNYEPFPNYPADEMWDNTLGDGSCVYPDKANRSVRSSIRVEALREASELNSLLHMAAQHDAAATDAIVEALIRGGNDYETDIAKMAAAHRAVLQLAAGEAPEAFDPAPPEESAAPESEAARPDSAADSAQTGGAPETNTFPWPYLAGGAAVVLAGVVCACLVKRKKKKP